MTFEMNDHSWLQKQIDLDGAEDCITGGELVQYPYTEDNIEQARRRALSLRFLSLLAKNFRRKKRMGIPEFSQLSQISESELFAIENNDLNDIPLRVIHLLSKVFEVSELKLAEALGCVNDGNEIQDAALSFACRSVPLEELKQQEEEALDTILNVLADSK